MLYFNYCDKLAIIAEFQIPFALRFGTDAIKPTNRYGVDNDNKTKALELSCLYNLKEYSLLSANLSSFAVNDKSKNASEALSMGFFCILRQPSQGRHHNYMHAHTFCIATFIMHKVGQRAAEECHSYLNKKNFYSTSIARITQRNAV